MSTANGAMQLFAQEEMPQKGDMRRFHLALREGYARPMGHPRVLSGLCVGLCVLQAGLTPRAFAEVASSPQQFLELWGKAWDAHDVDAIMKLYADDCVTVSRFGVVANGKDDIRRANTWLHNGPFHTAHFAAPKLLDQRRIAPGVVALQASWKNPSGKSDASDDDLVMTVVLRDLGPEGWLAEEIDMHTVEPLAPSVAPSSAPEHGTGKL